MIIWQDGIGWGTAFGVALGGSMGIERKLSLALLAGWSVVVGAAPDCAMKKTEVFKHAEIGNVPIFEQSEGDRAVLFESQMQVNTDGAPDSYHPDDIGITHICNGVSVGASCSWKAKCLDDFNKAKAEGFGGGTKICFFAMATNSSGIPLIQGPDDPKPGYFVSTTALKQPGSAVKTPAAQLDSNEIPFAVVPGPWQKSSGGKYPKLGDYGVAYRKSTGKMEYFVVGDVGPAKKLGEGSVALHLSLGNDPFVDRFGKRRAYRGIGGRDVTYLMFPGSGPSETRMSADSIRSEGKKLLDRFGGEERLKACAGKPEVLGAVRLEAEGNAPMARVQDSTESLALPVGVAGSFDREVFWDRLTQIASSGEVFRFVNKKGEAKEARFYPNVTHGLRRETITGIFDYWERTGGGHPKHLALILGTAYRETCHLLSTRVGEACGCQVECKKDELPNRDYGRKNSRGVAFFGRGLVQITHEYNYEAADRVMKVGLADKPDLAYEKDHAIVLLVDGVRKRWYAGKRITDYLDDEKSNWVEARNSVNPGSPNRAATGYLACRFYDALQPAHRANNPPQDPKTCMALKNI